MSNYSKNGGISRLNQKIAIILSFIFIFSGIMSTKVQIVNAGSYGNALILKFGDYDSSSATRNRIKIEPGYNGVGNSWKITFADTGETVTASEFIRNGGSITINGENIVDTEVYPYESANQEVVIAANGKSVKIPVVVGASYTGQDPRAKRNNKVNETTRITGKKQNNQKSNYPETSQVNNQSQSGGPSDILPGSNLEATFKFETDGNLSQFSGGAITDVMLPEFNNVYEKGEEVSPYGIIVRVTKNGKISGWIPSSSFNAVGIDYEPKVAQEKTIFNLIDRAGRKTPVKTIIVGKENAPKITNSNVQTGNSTLMKNTSSNRKKISIYNPPRTLGYFVGDKPNLKGFILELNGEFLEDRSQLDAKGVKYSVQTFADVKKLAALNENKEDYAYASHSFDSPMKIDDKYLVFEHTGDNAKQNIVVTEPGYDASKLRDLVDLKDTKKGGAVMLPKLGDLSEYIKNSITVPLNHNVTEKDFKTSKSIDQLSKAVRFSLMEPVDTSTPGIKRAKLAITVASAPVDTLYVTVNVLDKNGKQVGTIPDSDVKEPPKPENVDKSKNGEDLAKSILGEKGFKELKDKGCKFEMSEIKNKDGKVGMKKLKVIGPDGKVMEFNVPTSEGLKDMMTNKDSNVYNNGAVEKVKPQPQKDSSQGQPQGSSQGQQQDQKQGQMQGQPQQGQPQQDKPQQGQPQQGQSQQQDQKQDQMQGKQQTGQSQQDQKQDQMQGKPQQGQKQEQQGQQDKQQGQPQQGKQDQQGQPQQQDQPQQQGKQEQQGQSQQGQPQDSKQQGQPQQQGKQDQPQQGKPQENKQQPQEDKQQPQENKQQPQENKQQGQEDKQQPQEDKQQPQEDKQQPQEDKQNKIEGTENIGDKSNKEDKKPSGKLENTSITIRLTTPDGKIAPIAGAEVKAGGQTATTGSDGEYTFFVGKGGMINTSVVKLPPGWELKDSSEKNEFVLDGTNKTVVFVVDNPNYNPDKEEPKEVEKLSPDKSEKKDAQDKLNMIMSQEEAKPKEEQNKELIDDVKKSLDKFKNSPQSMEDIKELNNNLDNALKNASDKADKKASGEQNKKNEIAGNPEALEKEKSDSLASKFLKKSDKPEFTGETTEEERNKNKNSKDSKQESSKETKETAMSNKDVKKDRDSMQDIKDKEEMKANKDKGDMSNAVGDGDSSEKAADKKAEEKKTFDKNEKDYKKRPASKIVITPGSDKMMTYDENNDPIDGKWSKLDAKPEIIDNRIYMPIRAIAEAMGLDVDWNQETKEAVVDMGNGRKAVINTENNTYYYDDNGKKSEVKQLEPKCKIKNVKGGGRTMLSMRAMGGVLGMSVSDDGTKADIMWNNDRKTMTISRDNLNKKFENDKKAKRNNERASTEKKLNQVGLKQTYSKEEFDNLEKNGDLRVEYNGLPSPEDGKTYFTVYDVNGKGYAYTHENGNVVYKGK